MTDKKQTSTKFDDEDLKKLKELQSNYINVQTQFGQLHMAKLNVKKQFDDLSRLEEEARVKFEELQKGETELIETLTSKYGKGTLDPSTGEFTPSQEEKKSES